MGAECCKCSEEVRREFYDFAYHGLRAEHNDVVHRVKDLATKQGKMTAEEKRILANSNSFRPIDREKLIGWKSCGEVCSHR